MTEDEWWACRNPDLMVPLIPVERYQRELRRFATACVCRIWHLLPEASRSAVEASERFAVGEIDEAELGKLIVEAMEVSEAAFPGHSAPDALAYATSAAADASSVWPRTASNVLASTSCAASAAGCAAGEAVTDESEYDAACESEMREELAVQASLLRGLVEFPG
ncbi:hypothetical protein EP7_004075 [Isosphaeraceae bacterium EP7]